MTNRMESIRIEGRSLTGEVRAVGDLHGRERRRLFDLMHLGFENVSPVLFERDLSRKRWVLLLRCKDTDLIQGFSTAMVIDTSVEGRPVRALYSGDTVIHTDSWGERTVGKLWLRFALEQYRHRRGRDLYWFLISMGHRSYRLLRIFFKAYWPRHDRETPPYERGLVLHLGRLQFGEEFDEIRGVVARKEKRESMRSTLARINPGRLKDPDIAYFLERNPGYVRGDELACLAKISPENLRPETWRLFGLGTPDSFRGA